MGRAIGVTVAVVVGLLWGLTTTARARVWASPRTLWIEAVRVAPEKPRPWINLGREYALDGDDLLAIWAYQEARRLARLPGRSRHEQVYGIGYAGANLALVHWDRGEHDQALTVIAETARETRALSGVTVTAVDTVEKWISAQLDAPVSF